MELESIPVYVTLECTNKQNNAFIFTCRSPFIDVYTFQGLRGVVSIEISWISVEVVFWRFCRLLPVIPPPPITVQHPPSSYDTSTLRLFANTSAPNRQTQCSLDTLDTDRPGKLYRRAWHLAQRTTPRNSKVLANQLYTPINPSHD